LISTKKSASYNKRTQSGDLTKRS